MVAMWYCLSADIRGTAGRCIQENRTVYSYAVFSTVAKCKRGNTYRAFENRVLRRIFGPKRHGVTGGWRKLHNEELHNFFAKYN
jgi:hypothetical protein